MEGSEGLMKGGDFCEEWKKTMKRTIKPGVIIKIVSCFLNTKNVFHVKVYDSLGN